MEEFYGNRIGTQEETLATLVADLHAALKEAGIEANQISYATTPVVKLPLTRMTITFPVKSDYGRFKRLLQIFETGRRWIAVESVVDPPRHRPARLRLRADGARHLLRGRASFAPGREVSGASVRSSGVSGPRRRAGGEERFVKGKLALGSKRQAMLLGVLGARAGARRRAVETGRRARRLSERSGALAGSSRRRPPEDEPAARAARRPPGLRPRE